jgi:hypothetical protein
MHDACALMHAWYTPRHLTNPPGRSLWPFVALLGRTQAEACSVVRLFMHEVSKQASKQ